MLDSLYMLRSLVDYKFVGKDRVKKQNVSNLILLAYNAKWDKDYKINEIIDKYLEHITDVKPITARQCIKRLPIIAKSKPELKNDILSALYKADIFLYDESMEPLIYKDIQKALREIQKL